MLRDDYGRPSHNSAQSGPDTNGDILIMVPNSSVGALIGTGGSHIKLIIRDTNAFVTVRPNPDLFNPSMHCLEKLNTRL